MIFCNTYYVSVCPLSPLLISGNTLPHTVKLSKYFTIGNLQTKYILFVGLIGLLFRGLRYKFNPPIRKVLFSSYKFMGRLKNRVEWTRKNNPSWKVHFCSTWIGFSGWRRWTFSFNYQIMQYKYYLRTKLIYT
jgi:hypothetical protein